MTSQISLKLSGLIFFLICLLHATFALDYPSFNGYQILDLTSKNLDSFYLETQKWTVSGLEGTANSSLCGTNNPLLGGFGIFKNNVILSKTYSALPTHTAIYYQITFNFIDKFKNADQFALKLDAISIAGGSSLKLYNSYVTSNICGGSDADTTQFTITGSMPHTPNTLAFQLTGKFATGTGSGTLGIRDIRFTFANDSSVTAPSSCFRVFDSQFLGLSGECSCVKGSYLSSGTCMACNSACQNCFGPSASQCFACAPGYSFTGSQCIQCDSSCLTCSGPNSLQCVTCKDGYWLQANSSCIATCDLPVSARQAVGNLQLCYSGCTTSQYILWNGTCVNNCPSPLVNSTSGANKLCNKPCQTGAYLDWNNNCIAGCPTPLLSSTTSDGILACKKPCQNSDFLYGNGSCISGCSAPFLSSSVNGVATCNIPCQTGEFLYWNGSCIVGCSAPLSSSSANGNNFCNQPCLTGEYLDWNNNCIAACAAPLLSSKTSDGVLACNKPCHTGESLYWNSSCIAGCSAPLLSSSTNQVAICNKPCQTGEYLDGSNSCITACDTPLVSSTTSDDILTCNQPCQNSKYLYENSSCIAGCSAPFSSSSINGVSTCNKPCQTGDFLYWNNSCITGCSAPLLPATTSDNILICNKPCQTGEYIYWNNSCIAGCTAPLLSSTTSDSVLTCNQPCTSGEYLSWDNLCIGLCSTPLVSSNNNGVSLCQKPCPNNEFLYSDGSCLTTCPSPLISSNINGVVLCNEPCQTNEYLDWNGNCRSSCLSPLIPSSVSHTLLCNKPCTHFEFLYQDNSCKATCSVPYVTSSNGEIPLCNKPCNNNEFLYQDNSCQATCPAPLVSSAYNGVALCQKPCQNNEFLYQDNTCIGSCPAPLVTSSSNSVATCAQPCNNNEFLDWNNACTPSCLNPLVSSTNSGVALCQKPCQNNEFLYSDGSCLSTCPSPLIASSYLNVNLCQAPCSSSSQFLYPNGSCLAKCSAPLVSPTTADNIKRCSSPCSNPSDYYYNANNTCGTTCSTTSQMFEFLQICYGALISTPPPALSTEDKKSVDTARSTTEAAGTAAKAGIAASSLISSQSSGAITLVSLIKMLDYIRYMKINYPPKLDYMMGSQKNGPINMNFNVELPKNIENKFPVYPLPGKFGQYELVSNFFVNYWQELFTIGILFLVLATSMILASKAKDVKYVGGYSVKIRDMIKWNFFLIVFCGNVDSVGVFSSMEFRTTHFNTFISVFGTLVCVFINLLVLYLMLLIPYIILSLRRARRKVLPTGKNFKLEEYNPKADSQRFVLYGVLFMNFKHKSVFQHSCMFFMLLRIYLFNLIIGYLFEYPLTQAILINIMSALMLGYFSILRPYKNPLELIKTLTYESIIAVVNICVLILAIMDHKGIQHEASRKELGDVIIISNVIFNLLAIFYIVVELIIKIVKVYKIRHTITAKGWRYGLTIITYLLEPEELEMDNDEASPETVDKPIFRITIKRATKLEEKAPSPLRKKVSFLTHIPLEDQTGHDSDLAIQKTPSIATRIQSPMSVVHPQKLGIMKSSSIISLDGFTDAGTKNLLTPANAKTGSMLFSQGQLSPSSPLHNYENNSGTPSPRMLLRSSSQFSFLEIEQMKGMSESISLGTSRKLDEEKGILITRNKSTELLFNHQKDKRRVFKSFGTSSAILDNIDSSPDLSFEIGAAGETGTNKNALTRQQSRFSRYSPEKSKVLPEEDDDIQIVEIDNNNEIK